MRISISIKFFLFFSLFSIIDYQAVAQAPESMNYQAVIRDGSGNVVASQSVGIRIDILRGSATGTSVYQETFTPTTNAYGSIAIQIGNGLVVSGTFNTIDWGANSYYVETAVDISGGNTYTVISTTQFVSVPYALYAKKAALDSSAIQGMIDAPASGSATPSSLNNNFVNAEISNYSTLSMTFSECLNYCSTLNENGNDDWYLPSTDELFINGNDFNNGNSSRIWTRTKMNHGGYGWGNSTTYNNSNVFTIEFDNAT
jgi:hypothetical protein